MLRNQYKAQFGRKNTWASFISLDNGMQDLINVFILFVCISFSFHPSVYVPFYVPSPYKTKKLAIPVSCMLQTTPTVLFKKNFFRFLKKSPKRMLDLSWMLFNFWFNHTLILNSLNFPEVIFSRCKFKIIFATL